jgi:hypothetical protein
MTVIDAIAVTGLAFIYGGAVVLIPLLALFAIVRVARHAWRGK